MKINDLKSISENLINTFNVAGKESIELYAKGLKIEIKGDNWYINMGNIYLESEMKKADKADVELYKAWFEIALLLYGLSIKKTLDEEKDLEETDKLANLSLKSIAPTVIPVLRSLPNLKL